MQARFTRIDTVDQFEALIQESFNSPAVLLKHSSTCGTSADILHQLGMIDADIKVIVVQESRPLSDHVANVLEHRHHSPQLFVIRDGAVKYHATHYGINPAQVLSHLGPQNAAAAL